MEPKMVETVVLGTHMLCAALLLQCGQLNTESLAAFCMSGLRTIVVGKGPPWDKQAIM